MRQAWRRSLAEQADRVGFAVDPTTNTVIQPAAAREGGLLPWVAGGGLTLIPETIYADEDAPEAVELLIHVPDAEALKVVGPMLDMLPRPAPQVWLTVGLPWLKTALDDLVTKRNWREGPVPIIVPHAMTRTAEAAVAVGTRRRGIPSRGGHGRG